MFGRKYNIFEVSSRYCRSYYKFLTRNTKVRSSREAKELFLYGMKKICNLDNSEWNKSIDRYGEDCINYLRGMEIIPRIEELSFEDRVKVVSVCEMYMDVTGLISYLRIQNGRYTED